MGLSTRLKLSVILLATFVLAVLIAKQVDGINGPAYWRWPWRVYRGWPPYFILLLAAAPTFVAQLRFAPIARPLLPLLLMMGTVFGLELADRGLDLLPFDLTRVATIIEEPGATGYFTHAQEYVASGQSLRQYLHDYAANMHTLTLHARNKPPGSILFYVPFVRMAPNENAAAMIAGLCIALLATASVPATYWLVSVLTANRSAAFCAAALMSLSPGLVLFLPEFDQFYPVYSCALIVWWVKALKTRRTKYAIYVGLLFAFVCFQTFNLLVLGVFLLGYAILFCISPSPGTPGEGRGEGLIVLFIRQFSIALATLISLYALLWLWSGYNPIGTLLTGIANHQEDMPATHRVWPLTVPFDLTDFALGTGWVSALLVIFYLIARAKRDPHRRLVLLCLMQLIVVAASGLLAGETARVWIFMFPMLLLPAGLELCTWERRSRRAALACLWLLMALLSQNMVFV